jgi:hypothetical protein
VRLVERAIFENLVVYGAARDVHDPLDPCRPGRFEQLQASGDVLESHFRRKRSARHPPAGIVLKGRVNQGLAAVNQRLAGLRIAERAFDPLDVVIDVIQSAAVARGPMPTAQLVPLARELSRDITSEKPSRSGDGNLHGIALPDSKAGSPAACGRPYHQFDDFQRFLQIAAPYETCSGRGRNLALGMGGQ